MNWPAGTKKAGDGLVEMYHGHMDELSSTIIPTVFAAEDVTVRCVVATIVFGMGINIPDVAYVLHWGPATTMVAYWQQVERCGRSGAPYKAVLYVYPHSADRRTISQDVLDHISQRPSCCLRQQVLQAMKIEGHTDEEIDYCCFGSCCCSVCDENGQ